MFQPIPELNELPAECFVVVVKTARDMESNKRTLEQAVLGYLKSHITTDNGAQPTHPAPLSYQVRFTRPPLILPPSLHSQALSWMWSSSST
jgi:hypothetical protein